MTSNEKTTRTVLAINAFDGGSHRQFMHHICKHSRFDWHVISGAPVHWKWRMRNAPLQLAKETTDWIHQHGLPDLLFCTDMLDLPCWRGLVREFSLGPIPTLIYFHENQFTYPTAPDSREDLHYAYTNLLSAIAADRVVFNSEFHRRDFLQACGSFLRRAPDGSQLHDLTSLEEKSAVVAPGFCPPDAPSSDDGQPGVPKHAGSTCDARESADTSLDRPLRLGWVSRWEHDKRPDRFLQLLVELESQGVDFRLVLLGNRPPRGNPDLKEIQSRFARRILHNGFAVSREEYWRRLAQMDVVVSVADHEFFGIAVCEAIWLGATPLLPNRLSYPELAGASSLYEDLDDAIERIKDMAQQPRPLRDEVRTRHSIQRYLAANCVQQLDNLLMETLSSPAEHSPSSTQSVDAQIR